MLAAHNALGVATRQVRAARGGLQFVWSKGLSPFCRHDEEKFAWTLQQKLKGNMCANAKGKTEGGNRA